MVNMLALIAKFQSQNLKTRIAEHNTARDWARGRWDGNDTTRDDLVPPPRPGDTAGEQAWKRLRKQLQSAGPRALRAKLDAAIGTVNWGGDNKDNIDAHLKTLDLEQLAERLATDVTITGIAAVLASVPAEGSEPKLTRLSGYLEPITDPDDIDSITGLFQAWPVSNPRLTWTVRVYDFIELEMREWTGLTDPSHVGRSPSRIIPNASMPRVLIPQIDDGLVLGEFVIALPRLQALYATEFRLTRVEEIAAFPRLFLKGKVEVENAGSPASILRGGVDSDAHFLEPGNIEQLRAQRSTRREDLRDDLALPGGFLGNDSPSGEALREANTRYYQSSRKLAQNISKLLTQGIADYCALLNMAATETPEAVVNPNYEYMRETISSTILAEYAAGVIPLAIVARELQVFHPTWTDEELESFIATREGVVDPASVAALLGG